MTRLLAIAWKELIQLRRDRMTFGMMVGVPLMQLLVFGYAINSDVRHMPTLVYDQDHSRQSRDLIRRMEVTGSYDIDGYVRSYDEISMAMRRGRAHVAVVVPNGFGAGIMRGQAIKALLIVDGSDPQTVASAINTATGLAARLSGEFSQATMLGRAPASLTFETATWYNPEGKTAIFVVPGLVGVILTMTMTMFTAMALVRERERGTLEQLIVSPVRPIELVAGKIMPYIVIGYVQMSLVLLAGHLVFRAPIRGSLPLLYGLAFGFIAANLALGLLFSTIAKTQQQAMQMSLFFLLPNILLSGFAFPYDGMPQPARWLAEALPLTHFLRIVRSITLKGGSYPDVQAEFGSMLIILVTLVIISSTRISKKLG